MAIQRREIVILAMALLSDVLIFVLSSARLVPRSLGTALFNTFIYFSLCYIYVNRISANKCRILFVAVSLCLLIVIFSAYFYIRPRRWFFQTRVIFDIDVAASLVFLLNLFGHDTWSTLLFTSFLTQVIMLTNSRSNPALRWNMIFTFIVSITLYILLSTFHVKKIWGRGWKVVAIATIFVFTMIIGIILRIYWHNKHMLFAIIAGINVCLSLVPWLWIMCSPKIKAWWHAYHRHAGMQEMIEEEQYDFPEIAGLPARFTIKALGVATANFQVPIGEGASGAVFKGTLPDGSTVAVKRIKWQPSGETEFRTEMTIIASRQHVNLVRLLGYSISPRGDHYLIYPFLENGSLDAWIFADDTKRSQLTWILRYRIAIDMAKALAYLHDECHERILHLDIKPANILLDGGFKALLSDFGISKLIGKDESSVMTKARGTVGYLAPEMLVPNAISTKCDIYSYGMVILELIGGRRNLMMVTDEESQQRRSSYFPKIVREKMLHGDIMEVVDNCLVNIDAKINEEEVMIITRLALWCVQENPTLRPNMKEVVEILEGRAPVHVPPESSMFVVNFLDVHPEYCTSCQAQQIKGSLIMSSNTMSISIHSGR